MIVVVPEGTVTLPMPLSMVIDVALVEFQERVTESPAVILVLLALSSTVGATAAAVTVMARVAVAVPPGPVAVAV